MQSYATLVNNPRNMPKPQHVVGVCIILGYDQLDQSCLLNQQTDVECRDPINSLYSDAANQVSHTSSAGVQVPSTAISTFSTFQSQLDPLRSHKSYRRSNHKHPLIRKVNQRVPAQMRSSIAKLFINEELMEKQAETSNQTTELQNEHKRFYCMSSCTCQFDYESGCNLASTYDTALGLSIGPTRRASDDTCSLISSAASTSLSTSSSSSLSLLNRSAVYSGAHNEPQALTYAVQQNHHGYQLQVSASSSYSPSSSSPSIIFPATTSLQGHCNPVEANTHREPSARVLTLAQNSPPLGENCLETQKSQSYQNYPLGQESQPLGEKTWDAQAENPKLIKPSQCTATDHVAENRLADYTESGSTYDFNFATNNHEHTYLTQSDWPQPNNGANLSNTLIYRATPDSSPYTGHSESLMNPVDPIVEAQNPLEFTQYMAQNHYYSFNDVNSVTT